MGQPRVARVMARTTGQSERADARPPLRPYLILLIAVLLPGIGQVLNNMQQRGIMFIFFMMMFGWVTMHLAPPEASFVGRYAGGFFIYAISIMDAYRWARYRWEFFHRADAAAEGRSE